MLQKGKAKSIVEEIETQDVSKISRGWEIGDESTNKDVEWIDWRSKSLLKVGSCETVAGWDIAILSQLRVIYKRV